MNKGKYVFSQLIELFPKYEFDKLVKRYKGNYKVQSFTCWSQFLSLVFGQLTHRESLRDIVICLQSQQNKLYHLGIRQGVRKSTFADANKIRDWRIYRDFAKHMIEIARKLYVNEPLSGLDLEQQVYALDSTTIDLCLSVFPYLPSTKHRAALKLHTLMDLRGSIPVWIRFTDGLTHDMNLLSELVIEPNVYYVFDRGYTKFEELFRIEKSDAYFIIRAKKSLKFKRRYSRSRSKSETILVDQIGVLTIFYSKKKYPKAIRRIKTIDLKTKKSIWILTNNMDEEAQVIADLYRNRWQIELFFKWIKQHLKIKKFWGTTINAVKTQVWSAVCTYVMVAILKKKLKLGLSIYEILQILSVSVFDKTPVNQLLSDKELQKTTNEDYNQLILRF